MSFMNCVWWVVRMRPFGFLVGLIVVWSHHSLWSRWSVYRNQHCFKDLINQRALKFVTMKRPHSWYFKLLLFSKRISNRSVNDILTLAIHLNISFSLVQIKLNNRFYKHRTVLNSPQNMQKCNSIAISSNLSPKHKINLPGGQGPLLLTWFNFNTSMDK